MAVAGLRRRTRNSTRTRNLTGWSVKDTIAVVYFTTILTICSLYAAQPIQPVFQAEFHLSNLQAILFTTLMMAPLGIAPLFYGFLIEAYPARTLLRAAVLALACLEILFSCTSSYLPLLVIRGVQGLMIPAILTSLVSYISYTSPPERVQHAIATYIGATIMGGFLGRFLSGLCTDLFGWRFFFLLLGVLLLAAFGLLARLQRDIKMQSARPRPADIVGLLSRPALRLLYPAIFCLFFTFAALMNLLPFELRRMSVPMGATAVGLMYLGYASGVVISVNSRRIIAWFGDEPMAVLAGVSIFIAGTLIFMIEDYRVMFAGMFVFCSGLFMAHSLLSGYVNTLVADNKAIANGLYISFYYTGGTLGSFLPAVVFDRYGWRPFLGVLLALLLLAFMAISALRRVVASAAREGVAK